MSPESARRLLREASLELARLRRIRGASHRTWRRIARARKRLAFAAALLAAAAPAPEPAAAGIPVLRHGFLFHDQVPSAFWPAPALVDIDGDGDLDAFVGAEIGRTYLVANIGTVLEPKFALPSSNPFGLADIGTHAVPSFADLDGDGDFDAFIGGLDGSLNWFQNTGTATAPAFRPRQVNPFGLVDVGSAAAPSAADLDGDGDLDLIVGTYTGDLLFFRNTGAASGAAFAAPSANPFGLADLGARTRPAFSDIDGDGDLDAFVGGKFFLENTGSASSPTFAAPTSEIFAMVGVGATLGAAAFGDVDQDGDLDALVSTVDGTIALDNTGTASAPAFTFGGDPFGLAHPLGSGTHRGNGPTFADIDADGDVDAFLGLFSTKFPFRRNTGSASLPAFARDPANPWGLVGSDPTLADIDADGDLDAFVGTASGDTVFHANSGSVGAPDFGAPLANPFGLSSVGWYAAPEFSDIDGDGDLDAFIGHAFGNTFFFRNTGTAATPAFAAASIDPFGLADVGYGASPNLVDIDGDGDLDAVLGDSTGTVRFFENTGSPNAPAFAAPLTNPFGLFDFPGRASPDFADTDGDGDLDLIVGVSAYDDAIHFLNTGSASAPAFVSVGYIFEDGGSALTPALADLDGDGDFDALLGRSSDPNLVLVRNLGTTSAPRFARADDLNPFGFFSGQPELADIDADGDLDAFVGIHDGTTRFYENEGSASEASFAAGVVNGFGLAGFPFGHATVSLADADADGDLDALVGTGRGQTLWFGNTGTASSPAFAAPSTDPYGLADVGSNASPILADLDRDGDLDALIGNIDGNTLFFANTGSATAPAFAAPSTNPFGLADMGRYASPATVDIDGDGDLDVVVGEGRGRLFFFETVSVETGPCEDGLDNDGDGRIDLAADPGCANSFDTSELSALQCDNGLDDDGDGKIDWRGDGTGDPHCTGLLDGTELPPPAGPGCGLGPELLLLWPLLAARRRRPDATDG